VEVILLSDVEHVGLRGDVVSVARGYARNYLLPRQLAEEATAARVAELQKRDTLRARHEAKTGDEAKTIATRLEALELRFDVNAGPTGTLFGSVTPTNVADRLWEAEKIRVDRRKLGMDVIKRIGRYTVPVEIFSDVTAELKLVVAPEGEELPPQAELDALEAEETAAAEAAAQAAREADLYEEAPSETAAERAEAELLAEGAPEPAAEADEPAPDAEPEDANEPAADTPPSADDPV
jgi:large subunit ribosomal protein L9